MPDLNDILLFIAVVSPIVVLARTWRSAALNRGWQFASVAVLIVTGVAWAIAPRSAGFIGGGAWLALLFVPSWAMRWALNLASAQRYSGAARIVASLVPLHPSGALRDHGRLLRAMALAQRGARDEALRILREVASGNLRASRQAAAQQFRLAGDWQGLLDWCLRNIPRVGLGDDPSLLPLYFRALGELGLRDELVLQFAGRAPMLLGSPLHQPVYVSSLAIVFAFCGRTEALVSLFESKRLRLPEETREFWIATSEGAAGDFGTARARLENLRRNTSEGLVAADATQRLARRGVLPPLPLSAPNEATIARFERGFEKSAPGQSSRITPAVLTFIVLNAAMFIVETARGGSTNSWTLHRLGALEPFFVFTQHEYWRMLAALFLHYGALHLVFNLYALFILGPALESWIGSARFAIAYLVSGIGSSAGVLLLWKLGWTSADLLVGASGSVMGIVGAWAGVLLGHRHAPLARQRLRNIAMIVVLQTAFDFYTPQVSMAAHMSGLVSGFLLGLFITPKHEL